MDIKEVLKVLVEVERLDIKEVLEKYQDLDSIDDIIIVLDLQGAEYEVLKGESVSVIEVYNMYAITFINGVLNDIINLDVV